MLRLLRRCGRRLRLLGFEQQASRLCARRGGGSSGLDSLRDSTKSIVYQVRATFPQITTIYGVRQDSLPDHPSGRAIDLMMPNGAGTPSPCSPM